MEPRFELGTSTSECSQYISSCHRPGRLVHCDFSKFDWRPLRFRADDGETGSYSGPQVPLWEVTARLAGFFRIRGRLTKCCDAVSFVPVFLRGFKENGSFFLTDSCRIPLQSGDLFPQVKQPGYLVSPMRLYNPSDCFMMQRRSIAHALNKHAASLRSLLRL